MKNTTHRVVILNNVNSALISQAILILKDGTADCESNVLEEAERIVAGYMNSKHKPIPARKSVPLFPIMLTACALGCAILLFALKVF